jgi:RimJ/RimL family protein N-acetyltransferase
MLSPVSPLVVRPIGPDDREALAAAFERLSPTSRYRRFLTPKPRLTSADLRYLTEPDPAFHRALVAVERRSGEIVGAARYVRFDDDPGAADVAVAVVDAWHRRGVATTLLGDLIDVAEADGLERLRATALAENVPARGLLRRFGFAVAGREGFTIDYVRTAVTDRTLTAAA